MIKTKELREVVALALSGIKTADATEKNHLFHKGYIFSYSRALCVLAPLPVGCEHLEGVVNSNVLYGLLSKIKKPEMEIEVNLEESKWVLSSETSTAEIQLAVDESLMERFDTMSPAELTWHAVPVNFHEGLAICDIPSNKFPYAGLYVKGNEMVSTDGKRFHKVILESTIDEAFAADDELMALYISPYSVSELLKAGIKFNEFSVTDDWVYFRAVNEGKASLIFACNKLDTAKYPMSSINKIFAMVQEAEGIDGTLPPLTENLDMAQVFDTTITSTTSSGKSVQDNNVISLTFNKNNVTVSSERSAVGKYTSKVAYPDGKKLDVKEPVKIKVTGAFIREAMKYTKDFSIVDVDGSIVIIMKGAFFSTIIHTI